MYFVSSQKVKGTYLGLEISNPSKTIEASLLSIEILKPVLLLYMRACMHVSFPRSPCIHWLISCFVIAAAAAAFPIVPFQSRLTLLRAGGTSVRGGGRVQGFLPLLLRFLLFFVFSILFIYSPHLSVSQSRQ